MHLRNYKYSEFPGMPQAWEVEKFSLDEVNLLVGQNASGKSRVLNTIVALSMFLGRAQPMTWRSGHWELTLSDETNVMIITLDVEDGKVVGERLTLNGNDKLLREGVGGGSLWYEKQQEMVEFAIPETTVAMIARRDSLQHPYLEPLFAWAERIRFYHFSTDLGRQTLHLVSPDTKPSNFDADGEVKAVVDPNAVVEQYSSGYQKFSDPFDHAILADLASIGYDCEDVAAVHAEGMPFIGGNLPIMLQVKERDLAVPTTQFNMSTGMFRALAIIIHLNYSLMSGIRSTILIDDIGEGLDFARSKSLINLIIDKCRDSKVQIIMTSNDRFVMNEVSLEYWHVLSRSGGTVSIFDRNNSQREFESFKYLGLSNFDFFTSGAFRGPVIH
ncbi:AAA family ATPase [Sphingomonas desiccabilis]|uniref:ATP-binding protein n=1 Tax=Sphingomonas desiccabilis TaxID=429134 RepID=A0A4V1QPL9_9SPHN|nr:AAA family ATPase [Sphingomonas desiccabilis]MBB3909533.1 hypothetical protein [Sphingomonas desiccabilis]RXZ34257.1 ATP-binding protein [Sphingomonas desiccabilis]